MFAYPREWAFAASEWQKHSPFSFSIKFVTSALLRALKPVSLKIIG